MSIANIVLTELHWGSTPEAAFRTLYVLSFFVLIFRSTVNVYDTIVNNY